MENGVRRIAWTNTKRLGDRRSRKSNDRSLIVRSNIWNITNSSKEIEKEYRKIRMINWYGNQFQVDQRFQNYLGRLIVGGRMNSIVAINVCWIVRSQSGKDSQNGNDPRVKLWYRGMTKTKRCCCFKRMVHSNRRTRVSILQRHEWNSCLNRYIVFGQWWNIGRWRRMIHENWLWKRWLSAIAPELPLHNIAGDWIRFYFLQNI